MLFFNEGGIFVYTTDELKAEEKRIFQRFAKVFEQTYTRFLDLQKAEAQTREAQIEASLERVRAKAMSMRSSKDIPGATAVVFNELTRLGIALERCGIGIFNETPIMEIWSTPLSQENKQVVKVITGKINSDIHPMLQKSYLAWRDKKDFFLTSLLAMKLENITTTWKKNPDTSFLKLPTIRTDRFRTVFTLTKVVFLHIRLTIYRIMIKVFYNGSQMSFH